MLRAVRNLEQILEQVRSFSGADFVFVLTRKGRLVTHRAPREMPESGRARLVRAARPLGTTNEVIELTLPREELVPYGGAAPVDVYLGVAGDQAIVCAVMATWADKIRVASAIRAGVRALTPLLHKGIPRQRKSEHEAVRGSQYVPSKSTLPPPSVTLASSLPPSMLGDPPSVRRHLPGSAPDIHLAEALLGRESLVALRGDGGPEISVTEGVLGRQSLAAVHREAAAAQPGPEIAIGVAPLGRESLSAIHAEGNPRATSSPEHVRVEIESQPELPGVTQGRLTQPWVERPVDTKRAADAASLARRIAPPKVSVKLEDCDEDLADLSVEPHS